MSLQTVMFIVFILAFCLAIYKIYKFFPTEALADDDTDRASLDELTDLMIRVICEHNNSNLNSKQIADLMIAHRDFDSEHFWRFNQNRLNQLLTRYYLTHTDADSIEDIYRLERSR